MHFEINFKKILLRKGKVQKKEYVANEIQNRRMIMRKKGRNDWVMKRRYIKLFKYVDLPLLLLYGNEL